MEECKKGENGKYSSSSSPCLVADTNKDISLKPHLAQGHMMLGAEGVLVGMWRPEFGRAYLEIILGGDACQTGYE